MSDNQIVFNVISTPETGMVALHDGVSGLRPTNAVPSNAPLPTWTDPGTQWAYWGNNDLLPTDMRHKVEQVPIAGAALAKKIAFMQGEDLLFFYADEFKLDGFNATPVWTPEIEDWMAMNRIQEEWWPAQCADFCLPYNCFSEIILTNDRTKVENLYHISAEHARLSKAKSSNSIDYLIYSYHFPFSTAQNDVSRIAMPLYKWFNAQRFMDGLRGRKFAWHSRFPTPGLIYYARPWWLGLFKDNGWMDVSSNVPKIVNAMQNNQVSIKYLIKYPENYFLFRNDNWHSMTNQERQKLFEEKQAEINRYLSGPDNAGKALMVTFRENEHNGAKIGVPEIEAIDDKFKSGTWVPDSNFADSQIVQGLGMDPSQIGLAPQGGKMGAGSGSDKLQSYNQHVILNTADQRVVLEPLTWVANYNKWGGNRKLIAVVEHSHLTTQNDNRTGIAAP
jgi:hypothetical protein